MKNYGHNGHEMQDEVKHAFSVNAQTATHAEGLAFYNAKMSGAEGTSVTLITGRPACGYYGGIRSMAKDMRINDLTVVSSNNTPVTFNPQVKLVPNPFPKPVPKTKE